MNFCLRLGVARSACYVDPAHGPDRAFDPYGPARAQMHIPVSQQDYPVGPWESGNKMIQLAAHRYRIFEKSGLRKKE